jgi:hypothetical protein
MYSETTHAFASSLELLQDSIEAMSHPDPQSMIPDDFRAFGHKNEVKLTQTGFVQNKGHQLFPV